MKLPNTTQWAKVWILLCVYLNAAGWALSALGCLDSLGYGLVVGGGLLGFLFVWKKGGISLGSVSRTKLRWRFSHFFPAFFVLLCGLAFLGGALYLPNNYDALTYRFPRVLHWLSIHRWHWIDGSEARMNYSAPGFEWLMTPLFAFTGSNRFFFLINIISYAMLPGLVYAAFTRLGVARRVAWYWMWLLPCGGCFIAQAGSIGNDAFSAVYFLSAIHFTLQARISRKASDLWFGAMAAALLTVSKASNIPLLLPWLLAALPALGLLRKRIFATAIVSCLALFASFAPLAIMNIRHTGKWTGCLENSSTIQIKNPFYGVLGNGLQLLTRNAMPPVMPLAQMWNKKASGFMACPIGKKFLFDFPRLDLKWSELDSEEAAGLGLGLSALLTISVFAGLRGNPQAQRGVASSILRLKTGAWICTGSGIALLAYMSKMGSESTARLIAPYYPAIIAGLLLLPSMASLTRKRWWKACAVLAALCALPIIILNPSRPLWPALTVCKKAATSYPKSPLVARAQTVYSVYRDRADSLAPLREKYLSSKDKIVGFIGADDSEISLWRPFGQRKVQAVTPKNLPLFVDNQLLIFARAEGIESLFHQSMKQWLKATGAEVIGKETLLQKAQRGETEWFVIKLEK